MRHRNRTMVSGIERPAVRNPTHNIARKLSDVTIESLK
jgi:hypothetical protein